MFEMVKSFVVSGLSVGETFEADVVDSANALSFSLLFSESSRSPALTAR